MVGTGVGGSGGSGRCLVASAKAASAEVREGKRRETKRERGGERDREGKCEKRRCGGTSRGYDGAGACIVFVVMLM